MLGFPFLSSHELHVDEYVPTSGFYSPFGLVGCCRTAADSREYGAVLCGFLALRDRRWPVDGL